ncbi:hypothetical protein EXIGLDRAFT_748504 [Exidia glandulosa HHB12029]|uniref:Type 1 phosphatases regulator n=1 Tax=Exidia glandulosa HHB12029 TaxID=1314781 RepID=A0A165JEG9_EXIGL|nr:hypothetical protein EXIGLDRAFT_748504 [Exidia glandulosa HHB12029]
MTTPVTQTRPAVVQDGSRTITTTASEPVASTSSDPAPSPSGVLRLRGGPRSTPRVTWSEDIVDNEGCGKKSSKICCIYHKPRKFDESSDESDSDSDASDCDGHGHDHEHEHRNYTHDGRHPVHQHKAGEPSRNAYEAAPKADKKTSS